MFWVSNIMMTVAREFLRLITVLTSKAMQSKKRKGNYGDRVIDKT